MKNDELFDKRCGWRRRRLYSLQLIELHVATSVAHITRRRTYLKHRVVEKSALVADLVDDASVLGRIVAEDELLHRVGLIGRAARAEHSARVARLLVAVAVADLDGAHANVRCRWTCDCVGDLRVE